MKFTNNRNLRRDQAEQVPHYGLRKLSIGVASVLLSTSFFLGMTTAAHAATPVTPGQTSQNQTGEAGPDLGGKTTVIDGSHQETTTPSGTNPTGTPATNPSPGNPATTTPGTDKPAEPAGNPDQVPAGLLTTPGSGVSLTEAPYAKPGVYIDPYDAPDYALNNPHQTPGDVANHQNSTVINYPYYLPFTKGADGKYQSINLIALGQQFAKQYTVLGGATTDGQPVRVAFLDDSGQMITSIDPNQLDVAKPYHLLVAFTNAIHHSNVELYDTWQKMQVALNQHQIQPGADGAFSTTVPLTPSPNFDLFGEISYWSPFTPMQVSQSIIRYDQQQHPANQEALADQVTNDESTLYIWAWQPGADNVDLLRAEATAGLPIVTDASGNQMTLAVNSTPGFGLPGISLDGTSPESQRDLLRFLTGADVKPYEEALVKQNDGGTLTADEQALVNKYDQLLQPFGISGLAPVPSDGQLIAGDRLRSPHPSDSTLVLVPEFDSNHNLIPGKYAGLLLMSWTPGMNPTLELNYQAIDSQYQGQMYLYHTSGDGGYSGFNVLNISPVETATLTFHDDTDNVDLGAVLTDNKQPASLTAQGDSGAAIQFTDAANLVQTLEGLGYVFKDVSGTGANGATDFSQVSYGNFDTDPAVNQSFVLHFVHGTKSESTQTTVNLTVEYKFDNKDGQTAHVPQSPAALTFTGTTTADLVTHQSTTKWDRDSATFEPVPSPEIAGYTPDQQTVTGVTVTPEDGDQTRTVVYTAKVVHQNATLTFVDDDEGGKVLPQYTATASGDAGNGITFANGQQNLSDLLAKHYLFNGATDTTTGTPVKLQSDVTAANPYPTIKFGNYDNNDSQDQSFVIHLIHQTEAVSDSHQANLVVHYVYGNGPLKGSQAHADQTAPTITFTRTETKDLVTGDVSYLPWTSDQYFDAVPSPQIDGYAPDYESISGIMATPTTDTINETVTYHTVSGSVPSTTPSQAPSEVPSDNPSQAPSEVPSNAPSQAPSEVPSGTPSQAPSEVPSDNPSQAPSEVPSSTPSLAPSETPSQAPSEVPSDNPSQAPSEVPSGTPSQAPSEVPSGTPSLAPSEVPSGNPSLAPSEVPSDNPSLAPSEIPSDTPSQAPSEVPSDNPSLAPGEIPTTPQPSQTPGQPGSQSPSPSPARDNQLPQTGNQSSRLSWIGLGLLSLTALLGLGKSRRHD